MTDVLTNDAGIANQVINSAENRSPEWVDPPSSPSTEEANTNAPDFSHAEEMVKPVEEVTPVVETPVVETPVSDPVPVETPVVEAPVVEAPVVETPAPAPVVEPDPIVEAPATQDETAQPATSADAVPPTNDGTNTPEA
jgi:hypothetical protein